jgi:protein-serine/threonine kinase
MRVSLLVQELPWRVAKSSDPSFQSYLQAYGGSSSPPPLGNLPRECRPVIKRMLDPDPKTRATTDIIVKDKWFESVEVIDTKPPCL